jgi:hypothetical protein
MMGDYLLALLGPLAWFTAHVLSYIVVPGAHEARGAPQLALVDAPAAVVVLVVAVIAALRFRRLPQADQRRRFILGCAIALALGSLLLLVGLALPGLLLPAGAEL